jgi:hypothetical protein
LVTSGIQVPVNAIVGDVGNSVFEPADEHLARAEARVLHLGKWSEPINTAAMLGPKGRRLNK